MSSFRANALPFRPRSTEAGSRSATDSRSAVPCKFFLAGNCLKGSLCSFSHAENPAPEALPASQDMEQDETEAEDYSRTIAGAFVTFEDGARVSSICLPSDFSAVHLSGLPQGSTPLTVQAFLDEHGFDTPEKDIWVACQDGLFSANVRVKDPDFSKKLCALMQAGGMWGSKKIHATPVAARMPSGHISGRVDCKKVHVSWHKAVRTVRLNVGSSTIAERVRGKFATGAYTILGQKVQANALPQASRPLLRSHSPFSWSLVLTDVPASAGKSEVTQAISQPADKPHHIELGAPGYSVDDEQAAAMVRSLLTEIGPLEYWETTLESTAKRAKATARFLDETNAREAVSRLNGKPLPFHKNGKMTVQMVYSAKFKARSDIYSAVVSRVGAHVNAWKNKHISFRAYPSTGILKIEGESSTEVASAMAVLNSIINGDVVKDGQENLWDDSLEHNGQLWQLIKQQQRELGVVVVRNKVNQELRIFGTEKKCDEARRKLVSLFRMAASSTRVIDLDPTTFHWACRGGFKMIANRLGPEKAALDIISTPKSIIITGSLEDYSLALAIMNSRELVEEPKLKTAPNTGIAEDCSICWTEADSPIQTTCGHVYCQDCFESACAAPSTSGANFALLCHGDQGNCNVAISLQDLHNHLSSGVFEDVLERSFAASVQRAPDKLRFCPTPECGYIYRVTESARAHTCSNCLQPTCSACHEPHVDMTCAEYKDLRTGGYAAFEKLKKEVGIKDCPKCKTPIEKTDGCNHITCVACHTHICWVCLMTFREGEDVYAHMGRMHGGHVGWN